MGNLVLVLSESEFSIAVQDSARFIWFCKRCFVNAFKSLFHWVTKRSVERQQATGVQRELLEDIDHYHEHHYPSKSIGHWSSPMDVKIPVGIGEPVGTLDKCWKGHLLAVNPFQPISVQWSK